MRFLLAILLISLTNLAWADSASNADSSDPFMTSPSSMLDEVNGISMILPTPPPAPTTNTAATPASLAASTNTVESAGAAPSTSSNISPTTTSQPAPTTVTASTPTPATTTTTTTTPAGNAAPTAITQTVVVQAPPAAPAATTTNSSVSSQAQIQQLQAANAELAYSLGAQQAAYQNMYWQQQYQAQNQGMSSAAALMGGILIGTVVTSLVMDNHNNYYYYGGWGYPGHSTYINYHPVYVGPRYTHVGWGPYNTPVAPMHPLEPVHPVVPVATKAQNIHQWNQTHPDHQAHPYQPVTVPRSAVKTSSATTVTQVSNGHESKGEITHTVNAAGAQFPAQARSNALVNHGATAALRHFATKTHPVAKKALLKGLA